MMNLLEESGMIEVPQRIRMHGQVLHHRSTRQIKIEKHQDAFDTRLLPTLYPLQNMKDYDLLRSLLNDVMKVEGLGRLWQPGDNPPERRGERSWGGEQKPWVTWWRTPTRRYWVTRQQLQSWGRRPLNLGLLVQLARSSSVRWQDVPSRGGRKQLSVFILKMPTNDFLINRQRDDFKLNCM